MECLGDANANAICRMDMMASCPVNTGPNSGSADTPHLGGDQEAAGIPLNYHHHPVRFSHNVIISSWSYFFGGPYSFLFAYSEKLIKKLLDTYNNAQVSKSGFNLQ
jgi:hypothetical protein